MHTITKNPHRNWEVHITINHQQQTYCLRTDSSLSQRRGGGGLNAFDWRQIFDLDYVVVKTQQLFSSHGSFLINAIHHHRETI